MLDGQGRVLAQADQPLMSNHHRFTADWEPGQEELVYYRLEMKETPPAGARLAAVVYDPAPKQELVVGSGQTLGDLGALSLP